MRTSLSLCAFVWTSLVGGCSPGSGGAFKTMDAAVSASTGGSNVGGGGAGAPASSGGQSTGSGGALNSGGATDAGGGVCYRLANSGMHPCTADAACSAPRYTVHGDGTVSTTCCALTWQQGAADDDLAWNDAVAHCKNLSLAGGGWRLPTIGELESILDHCEPTPPAVDRTAFPNTRLDSYWSSTVTDAVGDAWIAGFIALSPDQNTSGVSSPNIGFAVRCVR